MCAKEPDLLAQQLVRSAAALPRPQLVARVLTWSKANIPIEKKWTFCHVDVSQTCSNITITGESPTILAQPLLVCSCAEWTIDACVVV